MEDSLPLNNCRVRKSSIIINRSYMLIHSIAIAFLVYYRASFLFQQNIPTIPWILVFASELLLSFQWLLGQAYRWRPVCRIVFPERLPKDEKLPAIDVFICTADPTKEPTVGVMNTVLSAMSLDYPPEKLHVYLSDDGGSLLTLLGMREAWRFARWWLPFCRRYGIKIGCPEAYLSLPDDDFISSDELLREKKMIKEKYKLFEECMKSLEENGGIKGTSRSINIGNHPPVIEVIHYKSDNADGINQVEMPLLVYVSREKRASHPHHFKAGALNVLLRVSSVISNSPYILVLDCDMYCNDPKSARQAMCFHLDPKISSSLAFVQFPQKFHNISSNDIYDSQLRTTFIIRSLGMDGIQGPMLSGTGFYIKREALYGDILRRDTDLLQLKRFVGPSNEFIKSLRQRNQSITMEKGGIPSTLQQETRFLTSCAYEEDTGWGKQIGFLYDSVLEDYFTGFILHCRGWISIFCNPSRPAFLGSATTNLNDTLVQGTRWNSGLIEVTLSRFCPLIYGLSKMPVLQTMCYGYLSLQPFYSLPLWCLATVPQLCLLNGIAIYPKASDSWLLIYSFVFLASCLKHLEEVLSTGGSIRTLWNEQRIWMIKSVTAYTFGILDAILKYYGMREASFVPTNKVADEEHVALYQKGKFNFQASSTLIAPLVTIVILNIVSFAGGIARMVIERNWDEMFGQLFVSFYILVVNYPIFEGMMLRKDKGRVAPSVTLLSLFLFMIFFGLGSMVMKYC